jgi:hemolysin activation/secretion protein
MPANLLVPTPPITTLQPPIDARPVAAVVQLPPAQTPPPKIAQAIAIAPPTPISQPEFSALEAKSTIVQGIPRSLDRTPQPEPPKPLPPTTVDPITPPAPVMPPESPSSAPTQIKVLRYEISGSTIFSKAELEKITQPFTGTVTFEQLQQAAQAVQKYYIDRRYLTSGAYIPTGQELKINGAVVKIQILEGKLEAIQVTGNKHLEASYIQNRIARATKAPLNYDRLVESVRLLQQNPLLDQVNVELSSGSQPGTNLLEVNIKEAQPLNLALSSDNNRSPSVGSWQRRIQAGHANLLGLGDGLSVGYGNTDGSNSWDVSYSLPLSPSDTTLSLNLGKTRSHVTEQPFNSLDIISKSRYYEATLRQPLLQSAKANQTRELAIGLTGAKIESETSLLDIPFKLSAGADPNGKASITALRFFQDYTARNNREVLSLRSQFNFGLNALGSTINTDSADSRFFHWQGQARWLRQFKEDLNLVVQAKVQLADRPLPSLEQFSIGGASTVRGYRQDVRVADSGVFGSIELQAPLWRSRSRRSMLQVAPFVDAGTVWSRDPFSTLEKRTLASVGLGLAWRSPHWSARIDWGLPLITIDGRKNSLQENGLYLSVRYSPF